MDRRDELCLFWSLALAVVAFLVGLAAGHTGGRDAERAAAVQAGVGRWAVDGATGVTRFEYRGEGQ